MELSTKSDWQQAEERMRAWWQGEVIDRPVIQVRAPRHGMDSEYVKSLQIPVDVAPQEFQSWYTDVERVVARCEKLAESIFWGGEAFPVVFPVSISMVAIPAAYLGCPYHMDPSSHSGWAEPIIDEWESRPTLEFNPQNEWWQLSRRLLEAAAQRAPNRFYVGVPDLNAPGEIVALLRGTQRFLFDFVDNPEPILPAIDEATVAWYRFWQAATGAIHQWIDGYFYWMGIWSDSPSTDLQCDFNVMISPEMFDHYFMPGLEQQTQWIERTIFHLDGPEAIRHLDSLLALPRLNGIQWVPGDGKPPMSRWLPLLRRIQAHGKSLVLMCEPWEVETLVTELQPEGLLLSTSCDTETEARELLRKVAKWASKRQWVVGG